jgi:hypothetical protein
MKLRVAEIAAQDTWKDIVRINNAHRRDADNKHVPRGAICRIAVGDNKKWVIVHGLKELDNVIQMDLNMRLALDVEIGREYDFALRRMPWFKSLWFPWVASDTIYRVPAQLSILSFAIGTILGLAGIALAIFAMVTKK